MVQMQVPQGPNLDGLDSERLTGRNLEGGSWQQEAEQRGLRMEWWSLLVWERRGCRGLNGGNRLAEATLNGMAQREGTNRVQIEVFQIPQNPLRLCWAPEQKHTCSPAGPASVQKCTHCLTCTWFVSHLVNLRRRSSRSGTDLHGGRRRCCPAAGWPLCQHPVRKCEGTAPRPAACTALRLVYTAQAKQCDCTSKHIVPILTHTGGNRARPAIDACSVFQARRLLSSVGPIGVLGGTSDGGRSRKPRLMDRPSAVSQ